MHFHPPFLGAQAHRPPVNRPRRGLRARIFAAMLLSALGAPASSAMAAVLTLRDGRILDGAVVVLDGLASNPFVANQATPGYGPILMLDDDLRRTYVPKSQVQVINEAAGAKYEKINIPQRVAETGARIGHVGDVMGITPFDEFGRRVFAMNSERGRLDVIQGMTLITPNYIKVEGLMGKQPFVWDCRLATSSIPRATLNAILSHRIDPKNVDDRKRVVRVFLQAERYSDAEAELNGLIQDFPGQESLKTLARELRQLNARKLLDEIILRLKVGQPRLAWTLLDGFPRDDIAGETLQQVREILADVTKTKAQGVGIVNSLMARINTLQDPARKRQATLVHEEIVREMTFATLDRMAGYIRLENDDKLSDEDKVALALSGWLVGGNDAVTNLPVALSMFEVRNLIANYLRETLKQRREDLLNDIRSQEAGLPRTVALIVAHMMPPIVTPEPAVWEPGFYELSVPGLDKEAPVPYYVQLPPEYDPYRRYPTIVTLNGAGSLPSHQIDWWAGAREPSGLRLGQATRNGYIVIAVDWRKEGQRRYEFSDREHQAVLASLRDACRRFAIDTDRVYLSGHSMGGDAVWDIALAHPDLWAGVIPIVAVADRYCAQYWHNGSVLPFYFVGGELDGNKILQNAPYLDRYFKSQSPVYDVTVVEFLGRGHEHFSDEIVRIFDWMGRKERNFTQRSIDVVTMRLRDNFFWWLELGLFPPAGVTESSEWPPKRGFHPLSVEASIKGNTISVKCGPKQVSVWLTPDMVDFSQPLRVTVNGVKYKTPGKALPGPDLKTLLEDVRTRGERLRPFWVRIDQDSAGQ